MSVDMADFERTPLDLEVLTAELRVFEARYGVPSAALMDAFRMADGDIVDTPDFHRWFTVRSLCEQFEFCEAALPLQLEAMRLIEEETEADV